ncbi:hypothetical protein BS50DRAFT_639164 [Corynespora cassiicola Philippines]|uniref:Uncharacterized protein n=1 Tax=Corynespora cassiicola Philippines TaxID=1448308 RepID=A0A2T2N9H8_CORCC|nr:hypothetical protein BS50DRAFT_639164 [Corynespora cassiicola Philippines]
MDLRSLIATKGMLPTENFLRPSFHDHSIGEQVDLSRLNPPLPRTSRRPPLSRTGRRPSPPTTDRQQSEAAPYQKPSGTLGHSKSRPIQPEERVAAQGDTSALPFVKQPEALSKDPKVSDGTLSLGKENIPPPKVHTTRKEGSKSPPVDRFIDPGSKTQELGQGIIHRLKIGECFHIDSKAPFGYLYAVSADGRSIATANPDAGYFTITTQNQEKKKIRVHSDNRNAPKIYAIRWSPCRDIVAVNVREGGGTLTRPKKHVRFYNISGKFLWSTQAIKDGDYQIVSLSHHGGYVLTYDETCKSVRCYRISGGQCRFSFPLRSKVGKISFDGKNLTLFLKESFVMKTFPVRGWKVFTRPSCVTQLKHSKPSLKWAPYLRKGAPSLGIVVEFDNITSAIVRDTENNGFLLQVPTSGCMHAFSRDEKLLAVVYNSQEWGHHPLVKVWDIRERVPIPRSPGQDLTNDHQWRLLGSGNIKRLQFLDDGTLVVFGNVSENGQTLLQAESLGRYNV